MLWLDGLDANMQSLQPLQDKVEAFHVHFLWILQLSPCTSLSLQPIQYTQLHCTKS
jgi:hypothetical protein